jgi:site-specific recombinase XerD
MASFTYFYCNIAQTPEKIRRLRSPRIPDRVPFVLAPQQVFQFIEALSKFRDKVIIQLLYSTGIRVSECVHVRKQDINEHRMVIRIPKGKGQKDRYVPLSPMMLQQLELYDKQYNPEDYIFYGRKKKEPMCRATVNRIIRNANFVLETKETITPHTFRHSFATMLTEEGESLYNSSKNIRA